MVLDATQIVVGANGSVYTAPTGTAAPADEAAALNAAFKELGYVTEDGVAFRQTRDIKDIDAWQSFESVRKIVTARVTALAFGLRQWNQDTLPFALGGGTIAAGDYEPPAPENMDERSFVLDWVDGNDNYRLYIPRGIVTSAAEFNLRRTDNASFPVEFSVLSNPNAGVIGGKPYKLFSDDPALGAV